MHLEHPPPCPPSCTHCLAFDNLTRATCTQVPSPKSKWCRVHEELQAKLLKSYKRLTLAFESHDDSLLPVSVDAIFAEEDLATLRAWSEAARTKWSLARRVIVARAEHHAQFYAGGDWGHCLFVETVRAESARMERFLRILDRRAYAVTLARSSASWVLDMPTGPSFVCNDDATPSKSAASSDRPLTPPPSPPLASRSLRRRGGKPRHGRSPPNAPPSPPPSPPPSSDGDSFFASLSAPPPPPPSSRDLLARLRNYLIPPSDLPPRVDGAVWIAFVETVVRHVVLRVPALATLALSASSRPSSAAHPRDKAAAPDTSPPISVPAFLDLLESRLAPAFVPKGADASSGPGEREIELLWRALKFARASATPSSSSGGVAGAEADEDGLLGVGVLADALDAVFREPPPAGEQDGPDEGSVTILGGRVRKDQGAVEWPRAGWDLFYQLIACPGCTLIATHSLQTWTQNRRLATLGHYPAWLASSESTAERVFRLSGAVLCTSNSCNVGRKVKRVEQKDAAGKKAKGGKGKKTVYIEEMERSWMYIKLPLDDVRSALILDHLASLPSQFAVLARRTAEDGVTHTPPPTNASCSAARGCTCCNDGDLWLNRVRSGFSPVERKAARWTTTSFFPRETILSSLLKSSSPETRFHDAPYTDTYDAVLLDASPDSSPTHDKWSLFADAVAEAILHAQGCETIGELLRREKDAAVERGEMRPGEWEELHACTAADGGGGAKAKGRKVVYVCEEGLMARRIFREE
ncbi:hypothetical protein JCM10449v2_000162 [Rhodotorula kratochvilovae]